LNAAYKLAVAVPHQGKCPGRNTSALAAAMAVKGGNNEIIYQDILTALADATNDLSMPCHEQWTGYCKLDQSPFIVILICTHDSKLLQL